jgi:hypothetical protein
MHANRLLGVDRNVESRMLRILVKALYGLSVAPGTGTDRQADQQHRP